MIYYFFLVTSRHAHSIFISLQKRLIVPFILDFVIKLPLYRKQLNPSFYLIVFRNLITQL